MIFLFWKYAKLNVFLICVYKPKNTIKMKRMEYVINKWWSVFYFESLNHIHFVFMCINGIAYVLQSEVKLDQEALVNLRPIERCFFFWQKPIERCLMMAIIEITTFFFLWTREITTFDTFSQKSNIYIWQTYIFSFNYLFTSLDKQSIFFAYLTSGKYTNMTFNFSPPEWYPVKFMYRLIWLILMI